MKLKWKLSGSDIVSLDALLTAPLVSMTMDELKEQPASYVAASCLFELQVKVNNKAREVKLWGVKNATITVTRSQALAFDLFFHDFVFPEDPSEVIELTPTQSIKRESYEFGLLLRLVQTVLKNFYA